MTWRLSRKAAIAGIGQTPYVKAGKSGRSALSLTCEAVLAACSDSGIDVRNIDGFATYGGHDDYL